jgi:hypothetical protein
MTSALRPSFFLVAIVLATMVGAHAREAQAQFNALSRRVPTRSNAIVFVDVERLLATPVAQKEGWKTNAQAAFESGLLILPPNVSRFVAAAEIDLHTMAVVSSLYAFDTTVEPDVPKIAASIGGQVDNIRGHEAAVLPGDYFLVKFTPRFVVLGNPAERQEAANYVRQVDSDGLRMSAYLQEAEVFAENNAPITMALDLTDAVPRDFLRARLDAMESLEGKELDRDKLADALATVRGLTLGINVEEEMTGSVKVDFAEDVAMLGDSAKPLLLEVLARRGMMIDELNDWTFQTNGKSIRLIGKLEKSGLRRIMSLIPVPPPLQDARQAASQLSDEEAQKNLIVAASQNYFKSVDSLVQDLKKDKRGRSTRGQTAVFFDRYADRIDRLPSLNVDPYLLDLGQYVSSSLRHGSGSVRTALVRGTIAAQNVPQAYDYYSWYTPIGVVGPDPNTGTPGGEYGWGGWGGVPNVRATMQAQSTARFQQQVQGDMSANEILEQVDQALGQTRRAMTQKFGAQF